MLEITLDVKGQKIALTVEEARKLKAELDALFTSAIPGPGPGPWVQPLWKDRPYGPGNWPYVVTSGGRVEPDAATCGDGWDELVRVDWGAQKPGVIKVLRGS